MITTPDAMHTDIAVGLAKLGYHILVEKPMAIKEEDCGLIAKTVHENNVILAVGHVMRFSTISFHDSNNQIYSIYSKDQRNCIKWSNRRSSKHGSH